MRLLLVSILLIKALTGAEKPNVLFIFADDMAYEAIGSSGLTEVKTPHLDRLFESGTEFTHAYNSGGWNGAICIASRTMMMTGRHLWHAEEEGPELEGRLLWPQLMKQAGYTTYMTGKWHVKTNAMRLFDHVGDVRPGMPKQVTEGYNRPVKGEPDVWDPADPLHGGFWEGGKHWSEVDADTAINFLDKAKEETTPFFIYLAFNAPHDPRQAPQEYLDLYPVEEVSTPKSFLEAYPHREPMASPHRLRDEKLAPMPRTEYAVKVNRREYFALITHMDAQIGRVLDALDKNGQRENTVIVFTADHGLSCGNHGLLGKQNMYDHSIRAPYVIAGPGYEAGRKIKSPIYIQDTVPTVLSEAGAEVPNYIEYKSFRPTLEDSSKGRSRIYNAYLADAQRALTKDGYKLILYPRGEIARLFHLESDPQEMNDLLLAGEKREIALELFEALKEEAKLHGDPLEFGNYPALHD